MAMCPVCPSSGLNHVLIDHELPANACAQCGGTLLSLVAYRRWRDTVGTVSDVDDDPLVEAPADSSDAISCSKCRRVMTKYKISAATPNRIDYCVGCEDIWLDDGEWELVARLVGSDQLAAVFSQSWQHRVLNERRLAMEQARLKSMLGADHDRVLEFHQWLADHPAREEILAYLRRGVKA